MASEKISQLPAVSTSSGGDLYPIVQSGTNVSISFVNLQSSVAAALQPSQLPAITLIGNVTGAGAGGTISTTIGSSVVVNSMLANMVAHTIKGNNTGSTTAPQDLSLGNVSEAISDVLAFGGNTNVVIGSGLTIQVLKSTTSQDGYLSAADWTTFNAKQPAGSYITALTGDGSAAGPGSAAFTLATVNSNIGTFGSSTSIPTFIVNAKGLITAASGNVVIAPAGTLSGITLNSTVINSSLTSVGTIVVGTWNGTSTSGNAFVTSGTTYTTPIGITANTLFKFTLVGGGGGGGYATVASDNGAGGGGGATAVYYVTGLTSNTAYTIAIGAAGAGGIESSTTAATGGGNTTLTIGATTITAGGGKGGGNNNTNGGFGGGATNGTINIAGRQGGAGTAGSAAGGQGGDTGLSYGLGGASIIVAGTGTAATGFGGGGGGAFGINNGGVGTAGCILVEWQN